MPNIVNGLGQVKVGVRTQNVVVVQATPLLDTYGGATAAYSLRKLRTAYTGSAIRVRRSSDNTAQDIGFDASGNINTTALLSFVGAGDGYVSIWYDQSGSNYNFEQSTGSYQPKIVINGSVVTALGEPAVRFSSLNNNYLEIPSSTSYFNFLHNGTDSTVVSVARYFFTTNPNNTGILISNGGAGSTTVGTSLSFEDSSHRNNSFTVSISRGVGGIGDGNTHTAIGDVNDTALPYEKQNLHFININAGVAAIDRIKVQFDNDDVTKNNTKSNAPSTANATNNMMMGVYVQGGVKYSALEGDVQELIIYNTNQDSNRVGIKNNINTYYSIYTLDAQAQAFITAAGITDTTQQNAIKTLVTDLKTAGVWSKMKAIYPMVGGTATSHKWNLKNPIDTNGAYRLLFHGGWTHSSTGALPNGSTAYASTFLNPSTVLSLNSTHLSYYSRTTNGSGTLFSSVNNFYNGVLYPLYDNNRMYGRVNRTSATIQAVTPVLNNSSGLFIQNRNSSTTETIFQNTTKYDFSFNSSAMPSVNLEMATYNEYGVRMIYSNLECSFASIGDGLTDAEATAFYTAVQKYQTTLGRQV